MFQLAWLVPIFPLLAFALVVLWANPDKKLSHSLVIGGVAISWFISWWIAIASFLKGKALAEKPYHLAVNWIPFGVNNVIEMGVVVDPVTAVMLFMVSFVLLMIFIYSVGYMNYGTPEVDPLYSRFFAYISLFATGMLGLVVADNLIMLFVFWEIMGLCSYLLIGFWFEKKYPDPKRITPKQAGLKAFLTTRIGDVIMYAGMMLLFTRTRSLAFSDIFTEHNLKMLASTTVTLPVLGTVPWATLIAMLIFGGAVGKSAQFPLHVWLPDAMEGPTPVSALIHAATMVSAGVYLVVRMYPLFHSAQVFAGAGQQLWLVATIGTFTALFAATIAVAQDDIKRVLAYSTISQLGYMFAALGIGAYVAAVFHLIIHAFFKGLLFLSAGSVIHGVEHGHHHVAHAHGGHEEFFDANDMMNMGGLKDKMPITFWTFLMGTLALAGVFPWSGFFSKDEILGDAFAHGHWWVYGTLAFAAFLTAFYMGREVFLTFYGEPRTEAAAHAPESPGSMTWPLIGLAFFATVGGFAGFPGHSWIGGFIGAQAEAIGLEIEHLPVNVALLGVSLTIALFGLFVAWLVYGKEPLKAGQPDPLISMGPVYTVLRNKYYVDEFYQAVIIKPTVWFSKFLYGFDDRWFIDPIVDGVGKFGRWFADGLRSFFDEPIVDGTVNGTAWLSVRVGSVLRVIQTGEVQNYLLVLALTVLMLLGFYLYL